MDNTLAVPKSVVITGGEGFVGKHLQAELRQAWSDAQIVSWDLPAVDVTEPETYVRLLKELQPQWVVHLAAVSSVPAALKDPDITHHVNVEGTRMLLKAIQSVSQDTGVLFVSTADIYGAAAREYGDEPISELPISQAKPVNPYAASKLAAEKLVEDMYSDQCIRVRPFPHIGPKQGVGFVTSDFASQIAAIESGKQKPLMRVGNLKAKRDFTDVRDVVRAYRLLMETGRLGDVYHVASGKAVSIQMILDMVLAQSTAAITLVQDAAHMRPSDVPVLVGDASKLKSSTGWEPTIPLQQSLVDVLDYWRGQ